MSEETKRDIKKATEYLDVGAEHLKKAADLSKGDPSLQQKVTRIHKEVSEISQETKKRVTEKS